MNSNSIKRRKRVALLSFLSAGFLALMLVASFGGDWGTAYGQTVPEVTPTTAPTQPAGSPTICAPIVTLTQDPVTGDIIVTVTAPSDPSCQPHENVTVVTTLPPGNIINGATSTRGTTTVNGLTVTTNIGTMNPGDVVKTTIVLGAPLVTPSDANAVLTATVTMPDGKKTNFREVATLGVTRVLPNPANTGGGPLPVVNNAPAVGAPVAAAPASAPSNSNSGVVGIIPGLPKTGSTSQANGLTWQMGVLVMLFAVMAVSLSVLVRSPRRNS